MSECVRCFWCYFSLQVIHKTKQKKKQTFFSVQSQPCSLLTVAHLSALCAPCAKCKQSRIDARLKSFAFFFHELVRRENKSKLKTHLNPAKQKLSNFCWCFQCAILLLSVTIVTCLFWFFFEGDLRTFDSIAFDSAGLLCSHSQGCFSFIFSLIFFNSIANFWLVFRIVFELFWLWFC